MTARNWIEVVNVQAETATMKIGILGTEPVEHEQRDCAIREAGDCRRREGRGLGC